MNSSLPCEQIRPMLAELATTAATGHDRAQMLGHVLDCPICQRELAELSRAADELLLLAPQQQPPEGFEIEVVQRIQSFTAAQPLRQPESPRRLRATVMRLRPNGLDSRITPLAHTARTARRILVGAVALILAAAIGGSIVLWRTAPDRQIADQYRHGLIASIDQAPRTASVTTAAGSIVGQVYMFPGTPAWILVALTAAPQPGGYTMSVVTTSGARYNAGVCQVTGQVGTAGYPLPVAMSQVSSIEMTRPGIRLDVHP